MIMPINATPWMSITSPLLKVSSTAQEAMYIVYRSGRQLYSNNAWGTFTMKSHIPVKTALAPRRGGDVLSWVIGCALSISVSVAAGHIICLCT